MDKKCLFEGLCSGDRVTDEVLSELTSALEIVEKPSEAEAGMRTRVCISVDRIASASFVLPKGRNV